MKLRTEVRAGKTAPRFVLASMALAAGAYGATLNVANNGVDSSTCGATASPCRSISQAIINAAAGDGIVVGPRRYGDLNADSIIGSGGDEKGAPGCSCLIAINKSGCRCSLFSLS